MKNKFKYLGTMRSIATQIRRICAIAILAVIGFLFVTCDENGDNGNGGNNDVYVAGEINGKATLWKNGNAVTLSALNSEAKSVFVHNGDVYVAGFIYSDPDNPDSTETRAILWKNGIAETLSDIDSDAQSVFVSYSGVYVAGSVGTGDAKRATVWRDGKVETLKTSNNGASRAYSVFVSDSNQIGSKRDVWVGGWAYGGSSTGVYWNYQTNSTYYTTAVSRVRSIFAVGSNVHLVGDSNYSVFVSGANVYIAGGRVFSGAHLIKNDVKQNLSNGTTAYSVYVHGSNVYVAGESNDWNACIWTNGSMKKLSNESSTAYSVFIAPKD